MNKIFKGVAILMAGLMAAGPAMAQNMSPYGLWDTKNGQSRYEFFSCGADGARLCAKLAWVREDKRIDRVMAQMDKTILQEAKQVGEHKWRGRVAVEGQQTDADIFMNRAGNVVIKGCYLIVMCVEWELLRHEAQ